MHGTLTRVHRMLFVRFLWNYAILRLVFGGFAAALSTSGANGCIPVGESRVHRGVGRTHWRRQNHCDGDCGRAYHCKARARDLKGELLKQARLRQLSRKGLMFLPADCLLAPAGRVRDQMLMFAETFPGSMAVEEAIRHMRLSTPRARREWRRHRRVAPPSQSGAAIAISGHELAFVMRYSDHVTWCTNGTTRELGSPQTASENDSFRSEFLGQQWNSIGGGSIDTTNIFPTI